MKKLVLLIFVCTAILSCSTENETVEEAEEAVEVVDPTTPPTEPAEPVQENLILGNWKLAYIYTPFSANQITDYTSQNITYTFRDNGMVEISEDNLEHDAGEYEYTFELEERDDIDGNGNLIVVTTLITRIDGARFSYQERSDGLIRLGMSAHDGQDLFLDPIE